MQVQQIMTTDPACCSPEAGLVEIAKMMASNDCGEIPVLDEGSRPVGVVTDRDIVCRVVAEGKDAKQMNARDIMTSPVVTVRPEDSLQDCRTKMEQSQIRRVPVVDENGVCCGMISQADIARAASEHDIAELLRDVSQPSSPPAQAG
ncbi:MAG: CBS domain-containing protein [Woeseia sp.]